MTEHFIKLLSIICNSPTGTTKVNAGLRMIGKSPSLSRMLLCLFSEVTEKDRATSRPISSIACLKSSRSSPFLIASGFAPIISTPNSSRIPREKVRAINSSPFAHLRLVVSIRSFFFDYLANTFNSERFDIGRIGKLGIRHNCGRITVYQETRYPSSEEPCKLELHCNQTHRLAQ